jgi:inhibitor of cysteine peptidase
MSEEVPSMRGLKILAFFSLIILVLVIGLNDLNNQKGAAAAPSEQDAGLLSEAEALPTVGSQENLLKLLEDAQPFFADMRRADGADIAVMAKAAPAAEAAQAAGWDSAAGGYANDYSQTNVQVQGVDEADVVKTDGEYIYKITNNKLIVARAFPAEEMKVVTTLDFGQEMYPLEMYVDEQYLTVILNKYYYQAEPYVRDTFENSVQVLVYDLSDRVNLPKVREVEIDGSYVSSRKIGSTLYLVNNKYLEYYLLKEHPEAIITPGYRDSAQGGEIKRIGYEEICYFPRNPQPNYLIIAGINLDTKSKQQTEVKTYLGAGQNVYCSLENLYVAVPEYQYEHREPVPLPEPLPEPLAEPADKPEEEAGAEPAGGSGQAVQVSPDTAVSNKIRADILPRPIIRITEQNTGVYKFNLQDGSPQYVGKGTVPGNILNQFSMDEHNGYFRIATTKQEYGQQEVGMTNNLFILDQGLNVTGRIENIAPGERIYSVRFLGDRGYMVTFKTVDPLFVLDLKDPNNPSILGELKIPGYSNYLHPYDENHIIGFGKEAIEVEEPHWSGQGTVKNAYYLGMKIALFDVSNVHNPVEKFKIEIGDRGTDSELFWNHKALLFSKEKNILAFPVTVYERNQDAMFKDDYLARLDPRLACGEPVFQGVFVYSLSPARGFELQGMITHQPEGRIIDLQRSGRYDYNRDIGRSLYIGDILYTISNGYLQANELGNLNLKGGIVLPN